MARSKLLARLGVAGWSALLGLAFWSVGCRFPHYGFGGEGGVAGQGMNPAPCSSGQPCVDAGTEKDCSNGEDDDKDQMIDCEDPDCKCPDSGTELDCSNGEDDDKDTLTDCKDPDCKCPDAGMEKDCSNGEDDDKDTLTDCDDPDCECPKLIEDCSNGEDDDKDGKTDCEDGLDCVCVPAVPAGWLGPVVIWFGSLDLKPTCSAAGAYNSDVYDDLGYRWSEPDWDCPHCSCGEPQDTVCSARITYVSGKDCSGSCWPLGGRCGYDVDPKTCEAITLNYGGSDDLRPVSASVEFSAAPGGICLPQSSPAAERQDPSWDEVLLACSGAPSGGRGCDAAHTCVPRPPADPFDRICVYAEGNNNCPSDYQALPTTAFGGLEDTRGCSECGCDAPTGIACTGRVTDYVSRERCDGTATPIGAGQCVAIPAQPDGSEGLRHVQFEDSTSGGTCAATGGDKTGSVKPTKPVTFCCVGLSRP